MSSEMDFCVQLKAKISYNMNNPSIRTVFICLRSFFFFRRMIKWCNDNIFFMIINYNNTHVCVISWTINIPESSNVVVGDGANGRHLIFFTQ